MQSDRRLSCLAVFSETRCGVPCCICCCPCFPRAGPVGHGASLTDATGPYLRPVHPRWGNFGLLGVQRLQARGQKSPRRSVRPDLTLWTGSTAGTDLVVKPMFPNISVAVTKRRARRRVLGFKDRSLNCRVRAPPLAIQPGIRGVLGRAMKSGLVLIRLTPQAAPTASLNPGASVAQLDGASDLDC